ncbi:MAG: deoxyribodipyrimidine photo-lyase, partial [Rubricoccaceae bacterium]|nr:deoxyribodipyrimidine photo-lyase [Rubricoccaceae bacterium]
IFAERLLHNPDEIKTGAGDPYQVFTPFWRKLKATVEISVPLKSPARIVAPDTWPDSLEVEDLDLTPIAQDGVDWATSMRSYWMPTEVTAQNQLDAFVDELLSRYSEDRNRPDIYGSSSLSPYLHHGLLSPRQVWDRVKTYTEETGQEKSAEVYLSEIGWREFAYHVLWHFPDLPEKPLKEKFESFDWARDSETFHRWQKGLTGYPIVDAGMRQLWALGWMHNRVRMIVGSFLTKHLLVPWQDGEKWFWDTLVDADLANNAMNWQWVAGCGPDAQPFFRIFNPITQGERYDPNGDYVRKWVPELRDVPTSCIHKPWEAPESLLASSGVILGESYPKPVVDHKEARQRALKAYERIK